VRTEVNECPIRQTALYNSLETIKVNIAIQEAKFPKEL